MNTCLQDVFGLLALLCPCILLVAGRAFDKQCQALKIREECRPFGGMWNWHSGSRLEHAWCYLKNQHCLKFLANDKRSKTRTLKSILNFMEKPTTTLYCSKCDIKCLIFLLPFLLFLTGREPQVYRVSIYKNQQILTPAGFLGVCVIYNITKIRNFCSFFLSWCFELNVTSAFLVSLLRIYYVLRVFISLYKCLCFRWYSFVMLFSFKAELVTVNIFLTTF